MTKKRSGWPGPAARCPLCWGMCRWGIAYGVMARQAGLNTWQTVLMSLTVYGRCQRDDGCCMVAQGAAVLTMC